LAQEKTSWRIDFQHGNADATDRSLSYEEGPVPAKVAVPLVATRVEERRQAFADRIQAGNIRSLMVVARETRENQITCDCSASMHLRDRVINLVSETVELLWNLAVFSS
jgi:hypothetical protein